MVKRWLSGGQTVVKRWLSGGQTVVKRWLFGGQNVKKRANAGPYRNPRTAGDHDDFLIGRV